MAAFPSLAHRYKDIEALDEKAKATGFESRGRSQVALPSMQRSARVSYKGARYSEVVASLAPPRTSPEGKAASQLVLHRGKYLIMGRFFKASKPASSWPQGART